MNQLMNNVQKFMNNMIKSPKTCEFRDFGQGSFCVKLTRPGVNLEIFFWRLCCKTPTTIRADVNKASSLVLVLSYQPGWWDDSTSCRGKSWCERDAMTWLRKRQRKHCPSLTQLTPEHANRSQLRCKTRSTYNLNISRTKHNTVCRLLQRTDTFPPISWNVICPVLWKTASDKVKYWLFICMSH